MKRFARLHNQRLFLIVILFLLLLPVTAQIADAGGTAPPGPTDVRGTPTDDNAAGAGSGNGSGGGGQGGHETDGDPDDYGFWVPVIVSILTTYHYLFCR